MRKPVYTLLMMFVALFCVSCTLTPQFDETNPREFLERPDIINLPFTISEQGLILVPVQIDEGAPVFMLIDTGATQSAIYKHIDERLNLDQPQGTVVIYGLVESGVRPELSLPFIVLDNHTIKNVTVAVLEKIEQKSETSIKVGGIIGLDILEDFYLYFDNETQVLSLIPTHYPPPDLPFTWTRVPLKSNPYKDHDTGLKYFDVRVTGQLVPALLDTGSEFNLINWPAINHQQISVRRKRLRDEWELRGAIGTFDPQLQIKIERLRGGQKFWSVRDFLVLNFESLQVLGVQDEPFIIAGADMFTKSTFWLNLEAGEIVFKPGSDDRSISDEVVLTSF